ncbi:SPOR domain-containing protein [Defluviimonas sp. SAOS-178_SWC]|uniref:SPOR domain-containing protein n=1 Tax=Defluviimonas sp. SAOS-178_SWC TaxID=3121287 RepID=UPI003221709C
MMRQGKAQLWVAFAAALALTGCEEGKAPFGAAQPGGAGSSVASPVSVERDVEAPNVFNLTGAGLWDGRPSLGGVWVAHSSVVDPERVMIRNPKNGKSVVGALFRRERDNPGPSLQVSSDAAEALGMLAGQPTDLSVVALRREEKPVPAEIDIVEEEAVAEAPAPEAETPATGAAEPTIAAAGADAAPAVTAEAGAKAAPAKKSGGLFGFLRKKPKTDPATTAPAGTAAPTGQIEQTTLDPLTASAAAAIDRADAVAAAPAPVAAPAPAPASTLKRAYVQIGIFTVEANAKRAADQMKSAGMTATVKADQSQGKTYWRVIVGPAASVAERDALASRVKGIGYPDAYPVSN